MEGVPSRSSSFQAAGLQWVGFGGILGTRPLPTPKVGSGPSTRMVLGTRTIRAVRRKEATNYRITDRYSPRCGDRPRHDHSSWWSYPSAW
jgi:hypothetical protein